MTQNTWYANNYVNGKLNVTSVSDSKSCSVEEALSEVFNNFFCVSWKFKKRNNWVEAFFVPENFRLSSLTLTGFLVFHFISLASLFYCYHVQRQMKGKNLSSNSKKATGDEQKKFQTKCKTKKIDWHENFFPSLFRKYVYHGTTTFGVEKSYDPRLRVSEKIPDS